MSDMSQAMVKGLTHFLTEHPAEAVQSFHTYNAEFMALQRALYSVSRAHRRCILGQHEVADLNPDDPPPADIDNQLPPRD